MVWIKRIEIALYSIIFIIIGICTYDFFNRFYIRAKLVNLFCNDTAGDCHFKIMEIYGIFHDLGSFVFLLFGQYKVFFLIGQIITLIIYFSIVRLFFYAVNKLFFKK